MKSEEANSGFGAGFLLGSLVGAAVALLISDRVREEAMGALSDTGIELKVKAEEVAAKAREEADDLIVRGRIVLEGQRSRVQEALEEGKEAASLKKEEMMSRYRLSKERGEAVSSEEMPGRIVPPGEGTPPSGSPPAQQD